MMEGPQPEFVFHSVRLFKDQPLGSGSYGTVCRAECDCLPCAAKILHQALFQIEDPGCFAMLQRFECECRLFSVAKHPNIVQHLGTYHDPDSNLPVLLMELCDESLTRFLERSMGPLPYHVEINICHDVALALCYLHANSLLHRDLTGNNVLMIAGARAKVTDFGMSKLADINPRLTPLTSTLCPGNQQYMPPEALQAPPHYDAKLDCFSWGVLGVQVMTRQFPDPGPPNRTISYDGDRVIQEVIPEVERRESHICLISPSHPLLRHVTSCLSFKRKDRPAAHDLCGRLARLKREPRYTESLQQALTVTEERERVVGLTQQVSALQAERQERLVNKEQTTALVRQQQQLLARQAEELQRLSAVVEEKSRAQEQLEAELQQRGRELLHQRQSLSTERERQIDITDSLRQGLRQKDGTVSRLQQALSEKDRRIAQLEQALLVNSVLIPPGEREHKSLLGEAKWEEGPTAPRGIYRGSAVVRGDTVYMNSVKVRKVYSYHIVSRVWASEPSPSFVSFTLAIVNDLLTTVGGFAAGTLTSSLFSLTGGRWVELLPPQQTATINSAVVSTEQALIVAGGFDGHRNVDVVEVLNTDTLEWAFAHPMPHCFGLVTATVCDGQLYIAGGYVGAAQPSPSVLTCSLADLIGIRPKRRIFPSRQREVWRQIHNAPFTRSTLVSCSGRLLAVGGANETEVPTASVSQYDPNTDSWRVVSHMGTGRYRCLAAALPAIELIVVGGRVPDSPQSASVEIATFL